MPLICIAITTKTGQPSWGADMDISILENTSDVISRQAAIDIERNATVDTNPSHFEAHQKFTQFMDDAEISSFGRWQWSNGFNTALTAVGIDLKKLPSAQPNHNAEPGKMVNRELNLSLTAKEAGYVQVALTKVKNDLENYVSLAKYQRVRIDIEEHENTIKEIDVIIDKVKRNADGIR